MQEPSASRKPRSTVLSQRLSRPPALPRGPCSSRASRSVRAKTSPTAPGARRSPPEPRISSSTPWTARPRIDAAFEHFRWQAGQARRRFRLPVHDVEAHVRQERVQLRELQRPTRAAGQGDALQTGQIGRAQVSAAEQQRQHRGHERQTGHSLLGDAREQARRVHAAFFQQ